ASPKQLHEPPDPTPAVLHFIIPSEVALSLAGRYVARPAEPPSTAGLGSWRRTTPLTLPVASAPRQGQSGLGRDNGQRRASATRLPARRRTQPQPVRRSGAGAAWPGRSRETGPRRRRAVANHLARSTS